MGQAKLRGSYEERKRAAIERDRIDQERRQKEADEAWGRMTREERLVFTRKEAREAQVMGVLGRLICGYDDSDFFSPPKLKPHHRK